MFVAFIDHADGGVPTAVVARCQRAGVKWLAIKTGDSSTSRAWGAYGPSLVKALKVAGIGVYTWNYSLPANFQSQIDEVAQAIAAGSDGHFLDAEAEWDADPLAHNLAAMFVERLRAAVGSDFWLAHCPWDMPDGHPEFPFAELDKLDGIAPQAYWNEHGISVSATLTRMQEQWSKMGYAIGDPRFIPIGMTYGQPTVWGKPPGTWHDVDLDTFLDAMERNEGGASPAYALYSYESCQRDSVSNAWGVLERREAFKRAMALSD
jgi:hypothetical protein